MARSARTAAGSQVGMIEISYIINNTPRTKSLYGKILITHKTKGNFSCEYSEYYHLKGMRNIIICCKPLDADITFHS